MERLSAGFHFLKPEPCENPGLACFWKQGTTSSRGRLLGAQTHFGFYCCCYFVCLEIALFPFLSMAMSEAESRQLTLVPVQDLRWSPLLGSLAPHCYRDG